jgi:hypothetical protein
MALRRGARVAVTGGASGAIRITIPAWSFEAAIIPPEMVRVLD